MRTIRIIAGERRGHRIQVPSGQGVRPTAERVREAIFDVLESRFPPAGTRVLDLFAGTGAMGLEALSRGAREAVFVEGDPRVAAVLKVNVHALRLEDRAVILGRDYSRALRALASARDAFELLFVDPPYRMLADVGSVVSPVLPALLAPGGLVVVEGPRTARVDLGLTVAFERRYGDTFVTMLRKEAEIR